MDVFIGYRYTCAGCSTTWHVEWSISLIPNTGFYDWTVYVDDPTNKEFIVGIQGEHFNGGGYSVLAWDDSDNPFTVVLSDIPTITPTPTPTFTSTATPTFTPTNTATPTVATVTSLADSGPGSLRQAIADAATGGTIRFDSTLAGQTITLASTLTINKNLILDGSGLNPRITISGNNAVRVLSMGANSTVTLRSLILANGKMTGTSYQDFGGAIYRKFFNWFNNY